jgi:hypothetical protein
MLDPIEIMPPNLQKPLNKMNLKELTDYGKIMGYKHGWAWRQRFNDWGKR